MYLRKTLVVLAISCSASTVFANDSVVSIASAILQETTISAQNIETVSRKTKLSDEDINERFNALSVKEKYKVLEIVRKTNLRQASANQSNKDLLITHAVENVIQQLKEQGVFIGDISDSELKSLLNESQASFVTDDTVEDSTQTLSAQSSSCPLKSFPNSIDYAVKPSYKSYASAYYYSNVVTTAGEWPCDTELWYNTSKSNVYGLNWSTRQLITTSSPSGYGGRLSKRTSGGYDRIVIGAKKYIWGLSDYALSNNIVIW